MKIEIPPTLVNNTVPEEDTTYPLGTLWLNNRTGEAFIRGKNKWMPVPEEYICRVDPKHYDIPINIEEIFSLLREEE